MLMDGADLERKVWLHVQRGCNGVVTGLLLTCSSNGVVIALQLRLAHAWDLDSDRDRDQSRHLA